MIALTQGKFAKVDIADLPLVAVHLWSVVNGYVCRSLPRPSKKMVKMHRSILGLTDPNVKVDHINHDTLDNRRINMRLATNTQNVCHARSKVGTSRFKGVSWNMRRGRWMAGIMVNRKHKYLGLFEDEELAARAYDAAALIHFGEFAYVNFKEGRP